jgi:hypothetical protein
LSFYDFYSATNDLLSDNPNAWLSTNCVAADSNTPPQQTVWPAIWGALIGEPTSCGGGGRRKK